MIPTAPLSISTRSTVVTRRIPIGADDNFQGALDAAQDGDEITLTPRAFTGFTLKPNSRNGMVDVVGLGSVVNHILASSGSKGWRLHGFEVTRPPVPDAQTVYDLVSLAPGSERIDLINMVIRGTIKGNTRRGVFLNGSDQSVQGCVIREIHETGADSQGICGIHGPGPYLINNTDIDAGGENIMFGGGDPSTNELVPSNITIRNINLFKSSGMLQGPWVRKNLLELKNARAVLIEKCRLFDFPGGVAMVLTPRNQDGRAPWCTVEDLHIRECLVQNVNTFFTALTTDNINPSKDVRRWRIHNNRGENIKHRFFTWTGARTAEDIEITHNTIQPCLNAPFWVEGTAPMFRRLDFSYNILGAGSYSSQPITNLNNVHVESMIRKNALVNLGDLDGAGPSRNRGFNPEQYISLNSIEDIPVQPPIGAYAAPPEVPVPPVQTIEERLERIEKWIKSFQT